MIDDKPIGAALDRNLGTSNGPGVSGPAMRPPRYLRRRTVGSIDSRLRRLEAETPAPTPTRSPEARDRMVAFLNRYAAWKRAGSPATEEGRELRALGDAVRRRCAERRGEG